MKIVIRTFGLPREIIENDWFEIELLGGATVGDLSKKLDKDYPELYGLKALAMFVNGKNVTNDVRLQDGDQVFLAPIVGGG